MKEKLISVIVCIYNIQDYVGKCIESIISQSYQNLDIILVDDGSTDQSGAICNQYKNNDDRIRFIHQANAGLSAARNIGIENAWGDLITFIDGDDYINSTMISVLYNNLMTFDADISTCSFRTSANNDKEELENRVTILTGREMLKRLYSKETHCKTVVAWNKLYKKELFRDIRFPIGRLHEDLYVTPVILFDSKKVAMSECELYYYVQRPDSITNSSDNITKKEMDMLDACEQNVIYFLKKKDKELEKLACNRYLYFIIQLYEKYSKDKQNSYSEIGNLNIMFIKAYKTYIRKQDFPVIKKCNMYLFIYNKPLFFCLRAIKKQIKKK